MKHLQVVNGEDVVSDGDLPVGVAGTRSLDATRAHRVAEIADPTTATVHEVEAADGTPLAVFADVEMLTVAEETALAAASPAWAAAIEERYSDLEVWLKIGQSNSSGTDGGIGTLVEEDFPHPRVLELSQGLDKPAQPPALAIGRPMLHYPTAQDDNVGTGYGYYFGLRRRELNPGSVKILMVHGAVPGAAFSNDRWNPGDDLYAQAVTLTLQALSLPRARFGGILWQQGETDSANNMTGTEYADRLAAMVAGLRADIGYAPFFCGSMTGSYVAFKGPVAEAIDNAHATVADYIDDATFVDFKDLDEGPGDGDIVHFNRQSLKTMGRRFADAAQTTLIGV